MGVGGTSLFRDDFNRLNRGVVHCRSEVNLDFALRRGFDVWEGFYVPVAPAGKYTLKLHFMGHWFGVQNGGIDVMEVPKTMPFVKTAI
jgi:hypothetical protein